MLNPVYRLAIDAQQRMRLGPAVGRAWRTTVVVPRQVCVFEQLPCAGVAWHERAGFARLQAIRLAPHAVTGGSAVVRQRRLMLWLWDDHEVQTALTAAGLDPARVTCIAEPLLLTVPKASGPFALRSQGGTDHLVLADGAVLESQWLPDDTLGRAPPDLLRGPWARDLLNTRGLAGTRDAAALQRALVVASWALAFGCAGYLAYWAGQWQGLESRMTSRDAVSDQSSTDFGRLLQLKQSQAADQAWLDNFDRLSRSVDVEAVLETLQRPMEANNLVIKELELRNEDLRVLVGSAGGDIDLPRVLRALTAVPGFDAVQLRQSADTQQASFTMRVAGFRESGTPIGGRP